MKRDTIREYKKLDTEIKALSKQLEAMKKDIMHEANESGEMEKRWTDIGYQVSECKRESLDTKALKAMFPDVYNLFLKETTFQRLIIK